MHRVAQRFQRHVQSDLVAKLETIRHRLGDIRNSQHDTASAVFLHAIMQRGRGNRGQSALL